MNDITIRGGLTLTNDGTASRKYSESVVLENNSEESNFSIFRNEAETIESSPFTYSLASRDDWPRSGKVSDGEKRSNGDYFTCRDEMEGGD